MVVYGGTFLAGTGWGGRISILTIRVNSATAPERGHFFSRPLFRPETMRADLGWAHIRTVRFVKQIPVDRRHNSKINYPQLRKMMATAHQDARRMGHAVDPKPSSNY